MTILQQIPQELFTTSSLATLAGCTGVAYVVSGGIQRAFNYNPKWLALVISILVSVLAAYMAKGDPASALGSKYIVAVLNGFLIYASATGTNQILGNDNGANRPNNPGGGTASNRPTLKSKRDFFTRWFS